MSTKKSIMRVLNVLLVDDEVFVVDWLSSLLESQKQFLFDIYRTYNAADALDRLNRTRIDILITDIQMPGESGLTLAEKATDSWPMCKVIMLTAHPKFNYVYSAMRSGVVSYLLKTEPDQVILDQVKQVAESIHNTASQAELLDDLQRDKENYQFQLKRHALFSWLESDNSFETNQEYMNILGFQDTKSPFGLLMCELTVADQSKQRENPAAYDLRVKAAILHYLNAALSHYAVAVKSQRMVWVLQPDKDCTRDWVALLRGQLDLVQHYCLECYNQHLSIVYTELIPENMYLPQAYQILDLTLTRLAAGTSGFIHKISWQQIQNYASGDKLTIMSPNGNYVVRHELQTALATDQFAASRMLMRKYLHWLAGCLDKKNTSALEVYSSAVLMLLGEINRRNIKGINLERLMDPNAYGSWADVCTMLEDTLDEIFSISEINRQKSSEQIILILESYIREHVCDDVSLNTLSEVVGYNPSYLSRFYSQNRGRTISEYITEQKMFCINELMLDTSLTINQIAQLAGFTSRPYFNNYIKRATGQSPQKHRQSLLNV